MNAVTLSISSMESNMSVGWLVSQTNFNFISTCIFVDTAYYDLLVVNCGLGSALWLIFVLLHVFV